MKFPEDDQDRSKHVGIIIDCVYLFIYLVTYSFSYLLHYFVTYFII